MCVRVFKLDRDRILSRLRDWAERISEDEKVLAVVLFGSLARGEATPASDADVLILLESSDKSFRERIPDFAPRGIGIAVDIFPYTIEEFIASLEGRGMAGAILEEGIVLHASKRAGTRWFAELQKGN